MHDCVRLYSFVFPMIKRHLTYFDFTYRKWNQLNWITHMYPFIARQYLDDLHLYCITCFLSLVITGIQYFVNTNFLILLIQYLTVIEFEHLHLYYETHCVCHDVTCQELCNLLISQMIVFIYYGYNYICN